MTATTNPTGAIVDLEGPDGGRYWRVTTGEAADHPDAISAAVHARVTGSVGCTYNGVKVERAEAPQAESYGVMPYHYRDNGEPCSWSGTPGWTEGMVCQNGCDGSKGHYANDGHAECSTDDD